MLEKGVFEVEIAEGSGRYLPGMNSSVHMLKRQALYDVKNLLNRDDEAYNKLIFDFEFMAKLPQEGNIIQEMSVGRKRDVTLVTWAAGQQFPNRPASHRVITVDCS
ncbi:unnamed protein product [Effrenium voratum]|nr:unnamed protein product [Effrenium voratum]